MSKKFTYKVLEEKEEPIDNIIEKGNVTVKFSMRDVEDNIRANTKLLKEWKGKLDYEKAKIKNIEEHHAFVKELTEEQCFTVHMYEEAKAFERVLVPKIAEVEESLAELELEKKAIHDQIGIPFLVEDIKADVPPEKIEPKKAIDL